MISNYLKNQKGATLVLVIGFILGLLGFTGLVIDVGNLYMERSRMQTTVDMAALAGAYELPDERAMEVATENMRANGEEPKDPAKLVMKVEPYASAGTLSTTTSKITVTLTKEVPTYIMAVFGIKTVTITVSGVATLEEVGSKYTIFSEKPATDLVFKNADVHGNVYSGGNIAVDTIGKGNRTEIHGDGDAGGTVANDSVGLKVHGTKHSGVTKPMPTFPVREVSGKTIHSTTKLTTEQLSAGVKVDALGGNITLDLEECTSPGIIKVSGTGNVIIKGTGHITPSANNPLFIYGSDTGTITLQLSSTQVNATIYVPKGKVIADSGSCDINGYLVANEIEFASAASFKITGPTDGSGHRKITRLIE